MDTSICVILMLWYNGIWSHHFSQDFLGVFFLSFCAFTVGYHESFCEACMNISVVLASRQSSTNIFELHHAYFRLMAWCLGVRSPKSIFHQEIVDFETMLGNCKTWQLFFFVWMRVVWKFEAFLLRSSIFHFVFERKVHFGSFVFRGVCCL